MSKVTAKIFGTGHLGHLLPPWAQASFSFPTLLTQSVPSVTVKTHIQPDSKRKILALVPTAWLPVPRTPLHGAPLRLRSLLFQRVEAFLTALCHFAKLQVVFGHLGLIMNFVLLILFQGYCILFKFCLGHEWLCLLL